MKKKSLKLTSKVLTGLVLFSGITAVPTKAVDVKPAAVDVNVANVKASVFEKDGNFYAKLVADKEVANVVARITTENKAEFLIKRDILKAGEEVVVELDMTAQTPTRKLPHTGVKKEAFTTVSEVGGHTFKITVRYEVATDEVKAQQKVNNDLKNKVKEEKTETPTNVPSISDLAKKPAPTVADPVPVATPAELEKPKTADNVKPSDKPAGLLTNLTTATTEPKTIMTNAPKTVTTQPKETKVELPKQTTQATVASSFEEQIKQSFIAQLNQLRTKNNRKPLTENAALNAATAARAAYVANNGGVHAAVHGVGGALEKAAAASAGFPGANSILYNVVQVGQSGTADQIAYQLLLELFSEQHNVTTAHPYGHRNTLLSSTSSVVGVGVKISNGLVTLVQHQDNTGTYNGSTPTPGVFLDGNSYIKK